MSFSLKKAFESTSVAPMHLHIDGKPCYAPTEVNKDGEAVAFDYDKPITFDVHCLTSEHGKRVTREWNRAKTPLENKTKGRDKTDKEIEESDAMFYNYIASLVAGWNNIEEKFSHADCREFLSLNFDAAQQVLTFAASLANYRKK